MFTGIRLSNDHLLRQVISSGALAFDGKGWRHEWPLRWTGFINPSLFDAVVIKTLTRQPRVGNLSWWHPWTCVQLLAGEGVVNKVGLTNPGIDWWCREVGPRIHALPWKLVGSIFGTPDELEEMTQMLNQFPLIGIEVNVSCPNTNHPQEDVTAVLEALRCVKKVSRHPIIIKVSVAQPYREIARQAKEARLAQALALNSVPWEMLYPGQKSPLHRLEQKVGGGGGGVSGRPAQALNWKAVSEIIADETLPVIAPSVMSYADVEHVASLGAPAVSYGAIHIRTPWKPTTVAKRIFAEEWEELENEAR